VKVVLAEDEQVGRGRAGGGGDGRHQVAGPPAERGQLRVIQPGQQLGMPAGPQEEPAGYLIAGCDLGGPQLVAEHDPVSGHLLHVAQQAAGHTSAHTSAPSSTDSGCGRSAGSDHARPVSSSAGTPDRRAASMASGSNAGPTESPAYSGPCM
jgi:hypothetical protein